CVGQTLKGIDVRTKYFCDRGMLSVVVG
ncbi:hypothetical protein C5S39_05815, partial [Candidatus Methanophagaceae archaeon]